MTRTILFPFAGTNVGGSHISTALIIKSLDTKNFKPMIVLEQDADLQKNLLRDHGLSYEVRKEFFISTSLKHLIFNLPRFLKSLFMARDYLKKNGVDIIHCDDGPARYLWFYASLLAGVPYIHVQRTPLKINLEKRISFWCLRALIANSRMTMHTLPPVGKRTIKAIIPPLLEPSIRDKSKDRAACLSLFKSPPKDCVLIGFLANMQSRKRPETFIRMASLLNAQYPDRFRFIMAGGFYDDFENRLKDQVRAAGLETKLVFTGFVKDAGQLLSGFDFFIAPAIGEAFGRTLIEAIALQTPVIASRDGGHCEIIKAQETGFLCEPDDVESFAEQVLTLIASPQIKNEIVRAAKLEIARYEANSVTRHFEKIYRTLTDK